MTGDLVLQGTDLVRRFTAGAEEVTALAGVSVDVRDGEYIAVMGPSGSGKTTLLNLLGGLDRPSAGRVLWCGGPFSELPERRLARRRNRAIGFVFQDALLMSGLSAIDNVRLPRVLAGIGADARRARALLERFGLGAKGHRLPRQLSRGEKQRVALARALANDPAVLLADEPTGNLDRDATRDIFTSFRRMNEEDGLTVVVATHDDAVREFASRVILLVDGRVAEEQAACPP